jgi:hypothetical protein
MINIALDLELDPGRQIEYGSGAQSVLDDSPYPGGYLYLKLSTNDNSHPLSLPLT